MAPLPPSFFRERTIAFRESTTFRESAVAPERTAARGAGAALHPAVRRALVLVAAVLLCTSRAEAQWNGFFHVNGGVQTADRVVTSTLDQALYGETATYEARMTSPGGTLVDAWAGVRLWGNLGVALGGTVLNARGEIGLAGSIPSPLFRNRHRAASFERKALHHQQVGVHLPLVYVLPVSERVHVTLSAGPSWYRLRHDALQSVDPGAETAPFTEISIAGFTTTEVEGTGFGYNAGVDATYLLYRWVGVGLYLRYTGGRVEVAMPGGPQKVDMGGAQAGAGLRFQF